jgi:hypothetical protein
MAASMLFVFAVLVEAVLLRFARQIAVELPRQGDAGEDGNARSSTWKLCASFVVRSSTGKYFVQALYSTK